jgi:flagellar P-ring protein precursor FlgI
VARVINQELGGKFATSKDATTIDLIVPDFYQKRIVDLISIIENFSVNPDHKAKIVINEKTGTIVAGGSISISPVALSHDNLTVKISQEKDAKGALPGYAHQIQKSTTIDDLVKVLNNIGATPEDMISIFQTLQKNGALRAEIELI